VASKEKGLRRSGYIAWHEISLLSWLERMNQMLAVKVTNYVIYGDPVFTQEYIDLWLSKAASLKTGAQD
jgi:hypothetical protein